MARNPYKQRTIGRTDIFVTPADWRDISASLKEEFPAMRFVHDPSFKNIDREDFERVLHRMRPGWTIPHWNAPREEVVAEPQPSWRVRYCEAIEADPDGGGAFTRGWTYAWIEPKRWKPIWGIDLFLGEPTLMNTPRRFYFMIRHGDFWLKGSHASHDAICAQTDDQIVYLRDSSWNGAYCPGEDAERKFLSRVRRIFDRFTTNALALVDYATGEVISRSKSGSMERVGLHALAWARAHPGHRIGDGRDDRNYFKPIDWEPAGQSQSTKEKAGESN